MQDSAPFFSICVPTRNRTETLYYCLRSLLHQDFDAYEIIVSDNCDPEDSARTQEIIKELASEKIKYFKPDRILSMTENYEFALSKAKGQFITTMGDDDGLVADSLQYVYDFIHKYKATVVKCCEVCYWWIGSILFPDSCMSYPLERPVIRVDSRSVLEKVASFEVGYFSLPMIYYSFVSRTIIDDVIREKGSFFQNSASIDMYSGFTIAWRTESFYVTDKPFAISGQSNKSNGSTVIATYDNKISQEYLAQHNLMKVYESYQIPFFSKFSMPVFVALELSKFKQNNGLDESVVPIQFLDIFIEMLSRYPVLENATELGPIEMFTKFPKYEADIRFIRENFFGKTLYYPKLGNHDTNMHKYYDLDPQLFGIKDVYGVSLLCKEFITSKRRHLPLSIPMKPDEKKMQKLSVTRRMRNRLNRTWRVLIHGNY